MNKKGNSKRNNNDKMMILMIICVVLSLITLAIVVYDKFIRTEDSNNICASCWSRN